ncbi:MAG TPA: hypothetical protein VHA07_01220 [Devosia sp.]|nr:hypothetical protein [Devosia sp.]
MIGRGPDLGDNFTTPVGLYDYARSYHDSARALEQARIRTMHRDASVWVLYFNAIELFLKTYLRLNGQTAADIETGFRTDIARLHERAAALGCTFDEEDRIVLSLMDETHSVLRSCPADTRGRSMPTTLVLERTATSLRATVCTALREVTGATVGV